MARPEDELHPTPDRRPDVPDNAHTSDAPAGPADGPTPGPGAPPAADAGHAAAPPPSEEARPCWSSFPATINWVQVA